MNVAAARTRSVSYEEYHPYGTTAWWAGSSGLVSQKRYRFTGMERDDETGLQCHGVRYYAVWLGRWVSADPIGLGDGVNRFGYCHGGVVLRSDLSGASDSVPASPSAQTPYDREAAWPSANELAEATAVEAERLVGQSRFGDPRKHVDRKDWEFISTPDGRTTPAFQLRSGVRPSAAIERLAADDKQRLDCTATQMLAVYEALRKTIGNDRFDVIFESGLRIGVGNAQPKGSGPSQVYDQLWSQPFLLEGGDVNPKLGFWDIRRGDLLTFKNTAAFAAADPDHAWRNENAVMSVPGTEYTAKLAAAGVDKGNLSTFDAVSLKMFTEYGKLRKQHPELPNMTLVDADKLYRPDPSGILRFAPDIGRRLAGIYAASQMVSGGDRVRAYP